MFEHIVSHLESRHHRNERRAEVGESPDEPRLVRPDDRRFHRLERLLLLTGLAEGEGAEPEESDQERFVLSMGASFSASSSSSTAVESCLRTSEALR